MTIQINRSLVYDKIESIFGNQQADKYLAQLKDHVIYVNDESSLKPYCVAINMAPMLEKGTKPLGGQSNAPIHLKSFAGIFMNTVFQVAANFSGAVATVEFLLYFDYFAKKEYGENYLETHRKDIVGYFKQIVYGINEPAGARDYQSVFWNISIFDKYYFEGLFGEFMFPDGTFSHWESYNKLQKFFMDWFDSERNKALLTFPVITAAIKTSSEPSYDDRIIEDREFLDFVADQFSRYHSFFIYQSDTVDSLSSCCRLRNNISDPQFTYTLGGTGISTGSVNVVTINMNRVVQKGYDMDSLVDDVHKYQVAFRRIFEEYLQSGLLPVYDAGYIEMGKQYSTIGLNGVLEAASYLGLDTTYNKDYVKWLQNLLGSIYKKNREAHKTYGIMFNTEIIPAENLGIKNYKWDKVDGLVVPEDREVYNSYFYVVEDDEQNYLNGFKLHGHEVAEYLDGGSARHWNLKENLTKHQWKKLIEDVAKIGVPYWTYNIPDTICDDCGNIDSRYLSKCPECGSDNIDHSTRIIGYRKRVSSFSEARRVEEKARFYEVLGE
jgi:ribonucleoside-triphosphate reductase (formate)